ncbi:glycosyltransferase [Flavicella sediminum]|uniref:glycosyltransferase n=1 Tax=Flavicella sediminum TaxID=2585141 RepID=UPI00111EE6BC|nr:glycosyltransferase [Flavicella sediminum]
MKLAIVTAYPPSKITLTEYAYYLVKSFRQHNDVEELILLTDKTTGKKDIEFEEDGCKITIRECWSFNSYGNLFSVSSAISETKPDAVLFNLQFMKFGDKKIPAALSLLLPYACKVKKIPTIVLLHNIMEKVDLESAGFTDSKIMQKIYGFIGTTLTKFILQADKVAVTMEKYVTILEDKYKTNNIVHIPHGTFEIPKEPDYSLPEGPLKIMTFGKFGTYKKVEIVIDAVEQLRKKRPDLDMEIVIAGTDNPNVPGYLDGVKEAYKEVKQLTFTGYVEEVEVAPLFNESAMVIFPYTSTTGSSGVLHQAGSYGKAVVMTNLGDLASLVEQEGYKGEFFLPDNVGQLADAIEKIATDETYRTELGSTNYKAATALPMEVITRMYLTEFDKLIQQK